MMSIPMRTLVALCAVSATLVWSSVAAAECPGRPGALGVERVIAVDPREHPVVGSLQYAKRPCRWPTRRSC